MKNWWFNATNILEREGYDSVTIRAADVSRANTLSVQLRQDGFQVQSLEMIVTVANRIVTAVTVMFTLIGSIALLVATIGIANTMVMAIYERTREIGILKAMGASSREIRQMFMLEAGFIGLIGGVFGLLIGWLLGLGLNQVDRSLFALSGNCPCVAISLSSRRRWRWAPSCLRPSSALWPACCPRNAPRSSTRWKPCATNDANRDLARGGSRQAFPGGADFFWILSGWD